MHNGGWITLLSCWLGVASYVRFPLSKVFIALPPGLNVFWWCLVISGSDTGVTFVSLSYAVIKAFGTCIFLNNIFVNDSAPEVSRPLSTWTSRDLCRWHLLYVKPLGHTCTECGLMVDMEASQMSSRPLFPWRNVPCISSLNAVAIFLVGLTCIRCKKRAGWVCDLNCIEIDLGLT